MIKTPLAALAFAGAALLAAPAHAVELVVPVPGAGWHLSMDVPAGMQPMAKLQGALYGGAADRFRVSAFVEEHSWCPGPETNENVYACYTAILRKSPIADWDTERGNIAPNGVQVMYMTRAEINGQKGSAFNVNILLAHGGKWVDVHFSMSSPKAEDVNVILASAATVKAVDDAAPATAPASAP